MNLFGALEAHANVRAAQTQDIVDYMRTRITAMSNAITTSIAAERMNAEARVAAMREQLELLIANEQSAFTSRERTLQELQQELEQARSAIERDLDTLKNQLLAGEFRPPVKYQQPKKEDTLDADALGLLPPSGRAGELETSVNET